VPGCRFSRVGATCLLLHRPVEFAIVQGSNHANKLFDSSIVGAGDQALDGLEGVRLAEALSADIVLMDLTMPVMNGLDATRRIKSGLTPPRVIIVTLHDDPRYRRSAEIAGADGFICKANFAELAPAMIDGHFVEAAHSVSSS